MQSATMPEISFLAFADLCSVGLPPGWSAPVDEAARQRGRDLLERQQLPLPPLKTALATLVEPLVSVSLTVGPPSGAAGSWTSVVAISDTGLVSLLRRGDAPLVEVTTGSAEELTPALQRLLLALPTRVQALDPVVLPWAALQVMTSDTVFSLDAIATQTLTPTHTVEEAAELLRAVDLSVTAVVAGGRLIGHRVWWATPRGWFSLEPGRSEEGTPLAVLTPTTPDVSALAPLIAEALG